MHDTDSTTITSRRVSSEFVAECRSRPTDTKGAEMHLDLTDDQAGLLRQVLDGAYRELRYEIADTDNSEFKAGLRQREAQLGTLLELVGGPLPDA